MSRSIIYDDNKNLAECDDWAAELIIELRTKNAALRAEKERLDWLDAVTPHIFWSAVCNHPMNPEGECAVALGANEVFYAKTYRAAIDAALANTKLTERGASV